MTIKGNTESETNQYLPVGTNTDWVMSESLMMQYIKCYWDNLNSNLTDPTTTSENLNTHNYPFGTNMLLLLILLFEQIRTPLPAAHEEKLTYVSLLPQGAEPDFDAISRWLTNKGDLPSGSASFCKKAFDEEQMEQILNKVLLENRYKVYANHPDDVPLRSTDKRFKVGSDYYNVVSDNSKLFVDIDVETKFYYYENTDPKIVTEKLEGVRYECTEMTELISGVQKKVPVCIKKTAREATNATLKRASELTKVAYVVPSGNVEVVYYRYDSPVYRYTRKEDNLVVYSTSNPDDNVHDSGTLDVITAKTMFCTDTSFPDGFRVDDQRPANKELRKWITVSAIPVRGRCEYVYENDEPEPELYRVHTGVVYTIEKDDVEELYGGEVDVCLGADGHHFKAVDLKKIYGTQSGMDHGVPKTEGNLAEGHLDHTKIRDAEPVTTWADGANDNDEEHKNDYEEHDVYEFRDNSFAFVHDVKYDATNQQWQDRKTDSMLIYEEDHIVGGRCELEENDVIGIDVNMHASYLGKRLTFRLLLQQYKTVLSP